MSDSASQHNDALILATDASTDGVCETLIRLTNEKYGTADRDDAAKVVVGAAGDALRLIYHRQPPMVLVCVVPACVDASAALIDALHQRRPKLPVLAVAAEHDEAIERAVRAAGVSYYFVLSIKEDRWLLRETLEQLSSEPARPHSGLSPPRASVPARLCAQPVMRPRPRYGRSSFE